MQRLLEDLLIPHITRITITDTILMEQQETQIYTYRHTEFGIEDIIHSLVKDMSISLAIIILEIIVYLKKHFHHFLVCLVQI